MKMNFEVLPVLETQRLKLMEITNDDLYGLSQVLSDPDVARYDYFYPTKNLDEVSEFINRYHEQRLDNEEITWGIFLKSSGLLIGTCCLGSFDFDANRAEVGYAIKQSMWGNGFATEAVTAIVAYGFHTIALNRIEATITPENSASIKVLEKIGFQFEGHVRQRDFIKGELVDGIIMGKLKEDTFESE